MIKRNLLGDPFQWGGALGSVCALSVRGNTPHEAKGCAAVQLGNDEVAVECVNALAFQLLVSKFIKVRFTTGS
ncbi:MAG: hypothetical protein ABSG98_00825 [Anaerolineales bacterium]